MNEEWRDVVGFPDYRVSNLGRVYSVRRGIMVIPQVNRYGYAHVYVKGKHVKVHRLVMAAFVGPSDLDVNHKNFVRHDNRLENLEYLTTQENVRYTIAAGRSNKLCGEAHPSAKLTWEQVDVIRAEYAGGRASQRGLARRFGVTKNAIKQLVGGVTWKTR